MRPQGRLNGAVLLSMFLSLVIKATKPSTMRTAGGDTNERQRIWSKGWPRVYLLTRVSSKQNPTPKHWHCEMLSPPNKDLFYLRQTASVELALKQQSGVYCVMALIQHNTPQSLSNTTAVQQREYFKTQARFCHKHLVSFQNSIYLLWKFGENNLLPCLAVT